MWVSQLIKSVVDPVCHRTLFLTDFYFCLWTTAGVPELILKVQHTCGEGICPRRLVTHKTPISFFFFLSEKDNITKGWRGLCVFWSIDKVIFLYETCKAIEDKVKEKNTVIMNPPTKVALG